MKYTLLLVLAGVSAFAQNELQVVRMGTEVIKKFSDVSGYQVEVTITASWEIVSDGNSKTFLFAAKSCYVPPPSDFFGGVYLISVEPVCFNLSESATLALGPVAARLHDFYSLAPQVPHYKDYLPIPRLFTQASDVAPGTTRRTASVAQPLTSTHPQMVFLDGFSYDLLDYDLTTNAIVGRVVIPSTVGPMGIRPTTTGTPTEVWVVNSGTGVTAADLGTQRVLTNIPTPSLPAAVAPAGIVFTSDGNWALEAVKFFSADSSGNTGALVVFDAVNRKVSSTVMLKMAPTALLISPDGYTAYLLDDTGKLVYYDLLSGTADLTTSTATPGVASGFSSLSGKIYVHPDGTRLLWNQDGTLAVFDLTTRKVVNRVDSGLPRTSPVSMRMAQDGATAWMWNALGAVVQIDPNSGLIVGGYQDRPNLQVFPGPSH